MKKIWVGMLAAACALCAGAGSYHLDTSRAYGNSDYPLNDASVWLSDDDGTPAGALGAALPSEHDYAILGDGGYSSKPSPSFRIGPNASVTYTFSSLAVGDAATGKFGCMMQYIKGANKLKFVGDFRLEKGVYAFTSQNDGVYNLEGDISVNSPASVPFRMTSSYTNCTMNIAGSLSAGADKMLLLGGRWEGYGASRPDTVNHTFNISSDLSAYYGTLAFSNIYAVAATPSFAAIRARFASQTMPGTLQIPPHMALGVQSATDTFSVDTLTAEEGLFLELPVSAASAGKIVVTNVFSHDGPITVYPRGAINVESLGTRSYTLLTAPASPGFSLADFTFVNGTFSTSTDSNADAESTSFSVETNAAAGTVSLVYTVKGDPVDAVYLVKSDNNSKDNKSEKPEQMATALTNETSWSDNHIPQSGLDYVIRRRNSKAMVLRGHQTQDLVFPGESLTVCSGCMVMPIRNSTFGLLRLLNGSAIGVPNVAYFKIYGKIEAPSGKVTFRRHVGKTVDINSEISGAALLDFRGWDSTGSPTGTYCLYGINTNFFGKIRVGYHDSINGGYAASVDNPSQRLQIEDSRALGAAMPEFMPDALTIFRHGELRIHATLTLPASSNRGITIGDYGRLIPQYSSTTFTVGTPLTVSGELSIAGPGTVALTKPTTVDEDGDGTPSIALESGTLRLSNEDAVNGLPITIADGASLVFVCNPADAGRTRWGLRTDKSATPFTLPAGETKLPIRFVLNDASLPRGEKARIGLVTVDPGAADAVEAMLPGVSEIYTGRSFLPELVRVTDDETGAVTFALDLTPKGAVLIFG